MSTFGILFPICRQEFWWSVLLEVRYKEPKYKFSCHALRHKNSKTKKTNLSSINEFHSIQISMKHEQMNDEREIIRQEYDIFWGSSNLWIMAEDFKTKCQ